MPRRPENPAKNSPPTITIRSKRAALEKSKSPAIGRSYEILDLLADSPTPGLTKSDITAHMGLAKSSVSNLVDSLESCGLVENNGHGYVLGRKIVTLASAFLQKFDPVQEFYRFCAQSDVLRHETVRVALLARDEIIYIARYEGHPAIHMTSNIGDRMPVSLCAVGKAIVARLDEEDIDQLFSGRQQLPVLTQKSIRNVTAFRKELREIRKRGYAIEDEEATPGVACIGMAVPTRGVNGPKIGVSVSSVKITFDDARHRRLREALADLVKSIGSPI